MPISIDIMQLISQILIGIGYAIYIVSRFLKKKSNMLLLDNISRITDVLGYVLFGNINGLEHTLFGIVRNEAYRHIKSTKIRNITFIGFLAIIGIMYGLAFSKSTILFIIGDILLLSGTAFGNEQNVRLGTIGACICNIVVFAIIHNYAGFIGEIICLIMTIFAYIINFDKLY